MEKKTVSRDTVNYPTTLFCLQARVKPVRVNSSPGKSVSFDTEMAWEVQGVNCHVGVQGWLHPMATLGAAWPPLPWRGSQRPKFYTGFLLLILQPQFQHVALGQTTTCTDRWSFALVGEGLVNYEVQKPAITKQIWASTLLAIRATALFYLF